MASTRAAGSADDNLYAAPKSEVEDFAAEEPIRLYSPRPIYTGSFLGGPMAGAWLLSRNFTKDLTTLGLSEGEAEALALANTRAALKPLMDVAKVAGPGRIEQLTGDSFYPSQIALFDTWKPLADAQGGKLIVVAPATDAVFYVVDDSRQAIDALQALARNVMHRAPHPLC